MLKCVFGIDGGGTKTVCLLADQNGLVRGRGEYGASNPNYISAENLKSTLHQVIEAAILSSGLSSFDLVGICLGVAGAGRSEKQEFIRDIVWEILTETNFRDLGMQLADGFQPQSQIQVYGDTVIALVAGANSRDGIVVISGTGSIVYGERVNGLTAYAGGWGPFLASEGSGYEIGRQALIAVVKATDGRGEPTLLQSLIPEAWSCKSATELFLYVLSGSPTVSDIASLTKTVGKAAALGDSVAINILKSAGCELFVGARAVATRLGFLNQSFPLVLSGGVLLNLELVATELTSKIERELPLAKVIRLSIEPAHGAVHMALHSNGLIPEGQGIVL